MPPPAQWNDDPECGHIVVCAWQTHYCTYIRVPKLLTLQNPQSNRPLERLMLLGLQAFELWFRMLLADLERAHLEQQKPEPNEFLLNKLFARSAAILRLLNHQSQVVDSLMNSGKEVMIDLATPDQGSPSAQFSALLRAIGRLQRMLPEIPAGPHTHTRAAREVLDLMDGWAPRYHAWASRLFHYNDSAPPFATYLALDGLLSIQNGVKAEWHPQDEDPTSITDSHPLSNDELLFIIVHQAFELWFAAILQELDRFRIQLESPAKDLSAAITNLRRVVQIQRLLCEQIFIPATMTPMDFLSFRDQTREQNGEIYVRGLSPASGTESYQFREIEILGGLKGSVAYREFLRGNPQLHMSFLTPTQKRRLGETSLPELFDRLLVQHGIEQPVDLFRPAEQANPHAQLAELADLLLEFDQFFQLWRVNHLTMVQSMIGRKSGTGYLGPEYLRETAGMGMQGEDDRIFRTPQMRPRFFERLWEARTRMQHDGPA